MTTLADPLVWNLSPKARNMADGVRNLLAHVGYGTQNVWVQFDDDQRLCVAADRYGDDRKRVGLRVCWPRGSGRPSYEEIVEAIRRYWEQASAVWECEGMLLGGARFLIEQ